tara:strand:- start:14376 stop:15146 length:771 start_codon:yes stop_codon:yes gene_type:complete
MFKPVDLTKENKSKMLMVYGPPGSGKSTLAARLAKAHEKSKKKSVIIDFEIGIRDALRLSDCKGTELYDLSDPANGMGHQLAKFIKDLRGRDEVGLVVIDTLSEMCWSLLRGICGLKQATLPMYGERKRQLKEVLLELRNLTKTNKTVLVLTHQTIGEVEGLPGYYAPECPKNDRADIVGQFDLVARLQVATKSNAIGILEPGDHFMDLSKDPQQVTKCRFMDTLTAAVQQVGQPGVNVVPVRTMSDVQEFYQVLY